MQLAVDGDPIELASETVALKKLIRTGENDSNRLARSVGQFGSWGSVAWIGREQDRQPGTTAS